jgi:hypothetical protein
MRPCGSSPDDFGEPPRMHTVVARRPAGPQSPGRSRPWGLPAPSAATLAQTLARTSGQGCPPIWARRAAAHGVTWASLRARREDNRRSMQPVSAEALAATLSGQHTSTRSRRPASDCPTPRQEVDDVPDDVRCGGRHTTLGTDTADVTAPRPDVVERVRATRAAQGLTLGVQEAALLEGLRRILFPRGHAR